MRILITLLLSLITLAARAQTTAPQIIEGPGSTLSQSPRPKIPHSPKLPYGLQLMARFDLLPMLRDTKCVQDSSYDRTAHNGDSGHFLRVQGDTAILADIRGPGCIYRFWSANVGGHLHIYFDGEKTPRIACPMQDLFLGKVAPFVAPIVGHKSGGWYCFFPMPFHKGCRIEVTGQDAWVHMYYQVEYQLFPDGTPVHSFTRQLSKDDAKALNTVLAQWQHMGMDPKDPTLVSGRLGGSVVCPPGQPQELATLGGPAEILQLQMQVFPAERFSLRQTVLRVYWDGATQPAIEAPVGEFFGADFGDQRFTALPDAMTDNGYVCFWPMPFSHTARLELVNLGSGHAPQVTWSLAYRRFDKPPADVGYFHAQWHRQTTVAGEPFHILQAHGRGHYVGTHLDMQGDRGISFLEGNEKIYVDGETFPSIYGTGTEDFFTSGWYFDEGTFNEAYHGCILKSDDRSRVSAYRYQIQDCVPFQRDLKVDIEHGGMNDYPGADYACVAYWYQDTPTHDWSPIDPAQLTPARYRLQDVLEAENLTWKGGKTQVLDDSLFVEEASNGQVMAVSGDQSSCAFPATAEDDYTLQLSQLLLPNSPTTLSWKIDAGSPGEASGTWMRAPSAASSSRWETETTSVHLKPGTHTLTLTLPDGTAIYLDYLRLTPVPKKAK